MKTQHIYADLRGFNASMRTKKNRLIKDIMKRVSPYMWECSYSFKILAFPEDKYYKIRAKSIAAASGAYHGIGGFTETGCIVTDAYCGALSTQSLSSLCIEDLINIWAWVERNEKRVFPAAQKYYSV